MGNKMTHKEIVPVKGTSSYAAMLDYHSFFSDCGVTTLREYFQELLLMLWEEGESFSGKRPFGNSGWDHDVYLALVEMGAVEGKMLNEDGYTSLESFDEKAANKLVPKLIQEMCSGK